jgi:hypothetical protein
MYESLPLLERAWVCDQARRMGLPGPDDFIVLLIRLEKQRQEIETALSPATQPGEIERG